MEALFEKLANADWVTIVSFLGALYVFNEKINAKIEKLDEKLDKRFDALDAKFERRCDAIEEKLTDVDRRLCRLEGAFASKDCCMIKDTGQSKIAE